MSVAVRLVFLYFQSASLPEPCLLNGWDPAGMGVTYKLKCRRGVIVCFLFGSSLM